MHYNDCHFLTLINYRTTQFSFWWLLLQQNPAPVIRQLEFVFFRMCTPPHHPSSRQILTLPSVISNSDNSWMNGVSNSDHTAHLEMVSYGDHILVQHHTQGRYSCFVRAFSLPHSYQIQLKAIYVVSSPDHQGILTQYRERDAVCMKNPQEHCISKFKLGHVT